MRGFWCAARRCWRRWRRSDTVVVDKTGTLTEGKLVWLLWRRLRVGDEAGVMRVAGSLEKASEHPLGAAVLGWMKEKSVSVVEVTGFEAVTGKGVTGLVEGKKAGIGSEALLLELGFAASVVEGWKTRADALRGEGQTVMFVAVESVVAGMVGVADPIRESTAEALAQLREASVRVVMATGGITRRQRRRLRRSWE